jgi:hypothetical protein
LSFNESFNQSKIEIDIRSENDDDYDEFDGFNESADDFFRNSSFSLDSLSNIQKRIILEEFCEILSDTECSNNDEKFIEQLGLSYPKATRPHTMNSTQSSGSSLTSGDTNDVPATTINQILQVM